MLPLQWLDCIGVKDSLHQDVAVGVDPSLAGGEGRTWRSGEGRILIGLALFAFALRVVYVFGLRDSPYFEEPVIDAAYHLDWARALAAGEEFESGPFFRAPLYPWFLALALKLCGGSLLGVRLMQCALGASTAVLTYLIGRRAFDRRVALLSGLAAATYWVLIYFDGELLLPTLAIPLNLLALWLSLELVQASSTRGRRALVAGLAWGAAAITRPNGLLFMPLLAIWLFTRGGWSAASGSNNRGGDSKALQSTGSPWMACAMLTLGTLIPILPLTAYNGWVAGDSVLISSQAGVNLWIGNHPGADGRTAKVPGTLGDDFHGTAREAAALASQAEGRVLTPSEVSDHYTQKALGYMRSQPGAAAAGLLNKAGLFLRDEEISNNQPVRFFAHHFSAVARWSPLGFTPLLTLGLLGLAVLLAGSDRWARFPLWGFLLTYSLSVVVFFVCSRFRAPVLPLLMVLGSHGVVWVVDEWRSGRRRGPWLWGAGLVIGLSLLAGTRGDRREAEADGLRHLAVGHGLAGEQALAESLSKRALDQAPKDRQTLLARAGILEDGGSFELAGDCLERAREVYPQDAQVLDRALGLMARRGQWAAVERGAQAILDGGQPKGEPTQALVASAQYHLATALKAQNRLGEALAAMEEAVRLDPGGSRAQAVLGSFLASRGKSKRAITLLGQALDHRAFHHSERQEQDTFRLLVLLLGRAGLEEQARERILQWQERFPESRVPGGTRGRPGPSDA